MTVNTLIGLNMRMNGMKKMTKLKIPIRKFNVNQQDVKNIKIEDMSQAIMKCMVGSGEIFMPAIMGVLGSVIYSRAETIPKAQLDTYVKDMETMMLDVLAMVKEKVLHDE